MFTLSEKFVLVTRQWAPIANEYASLLNRYGLSTITVKSGRCNFGIMVSVLADEDKYLELCLNKKYKLAEEQFDRMARTIEGLTYTIFNLEDDEDEEFDDEDYDEFEDDTDDEL